MYTTLNIHLPPQKLVMKNNPIILAYINFNPWPIRAVRCAWT